MKKMDELQKEYRKMWRKLGFNKPPCELLTKADNRGGRHVEYKDGKYFWTATEYGSWLEFQETNRMEEVLEWIALYITEWQAFGSVQGSGKKGRERDIWQLAYGFPPIDSHSVICIIYKAQYISQLQKRIVCPSR